MLSHVEEEEMKKCDKSFFHFAANWVKIYHPKKGLINFNLHQYQERLVHTYDKNRFTILTKFRAGGFTTTTILWMLWRCMFKKDERVLYCCKTNGEAKEVNNIVRTALDNLPEWLAPKIDKRNNHEIRFANTGGELVFFTLRACRGRMVRWLVIDEAAFIPNMENHWKSAFPMLSCGGNCIIMSTTNGLGNWFEQTYNNAIKNKNTFHVFKSDYTENQDYNSPKWVNLMKQNMGAKGWAQEVLQCFVS